MKSKKCIFTILFVFSFTLLLFSAEEEEENFEEFKKYREKAVQSYEDSNLELALLYFDSAQIVAETFKNSAFSIDVQRQIGMVYLKMDSAFLAIEELKLVRQKATQLANDTLIAKTLIDLGLAYQEIGMLDSVMGNYNRAKSIYEKLNDNKGKALVLNNVSIYYKLTARYGEALKSSLESYWIWKEYPESKQFIRSLINLGNIYEILREYDTAKSCYQLSYELSVKYKMGNLATTSLTNLGVVHYRNKEYQEVKTIFHEVIDYYKEVGDNRELGRMYSNISLVYFRLDRIDSAIIIVKKSIDLADETSDNQGKMRALNNLGIYYKNSGRYNEAEEVYNQSIHIAQKMNLLFDMKSGYNNLANIYEEKGDYKKALDYFRIRSELKDSILDQTKMKEIASLKTQYQILMLNDQKTIAELKEKKIRTERNITFFSAIGIVVLLLWIAIYFRMRIGKNKIISAQKIQQLEDEKKILAAQSVIVGQEEERKRIAQELHDGIGVLLSTASIHFSSLTRDDNPEKAKNIFRKAHKMLDEAGSEVRKISQNMMPGVLSKFGLKEAIEDLFDEVEETGSVRTDVTLICSTDRLPENLEIMIYRVVQEMINNTLKHAEASDITCRLKRNHETIIIEYSDNGKGFEEAKLPHNKSLGIFGIRSRVDFLGGKVDLKSELGAGTTYEIGIPLSQNMNRN